MNISEMPALIDKEAVAGLHFPSEEVLTSADLIVRRSNELDKAGMLGNMDHVKVKIVFEDTEGLKQVETTVWAVTKDAIVLKRGVTIPIRRIHEIR
jgi:hypothetical protein